jgi:3-phosphoshikimate 1-carboxyvinyltransferase
MTSRLAWPSQLTLPGDKSLSHRLLLMAAMAEGESELLDLSKGQDVRSTLTALQSLGIEIQQFGNLTKVKGQGFQRLRLNNQTIDCGNSGTTARHLIGLLSCGEGKVRLVGDESLSARPMKRISEPLLQMGASIQLHESGTLPAMIEGKTLHELQYELPIPSAQIKSSLMLTACMARVPLILTGRLEGRNHTEKLIPFFGGDVHVSNQVVIPEQKSWRPVKYSVPRDPSALANWLAAALLTDREASFDRVLLNPSRLGFISALQQMGANIKIEIEAQFPELVGKIYFKPSILHGTEINVPSSHFIDEAPLLALIASQSKDTTVIKDLSELRVKECDRFQVTGEILREMGVEIQAEGDSWKIKGKQRLRPAKINTHNDHRMAMLGLIAGLLTTVEVDNLSSLKISDPHMWEAVC